MRRVRQHVNPLKSDLLEIEVPRIEVPAGKRLEVELGSGEAHFLIERARMDPQTAFVGVEIRREVVWRANRACQLAGIGNVQSVFANMSVDMGELFAARSVSRFFLNFPDPWFKSRQHKRRVVSPLLIADIGAALCPGGEMFVQTDIFAIALEAMATLEGDAGDTGLDNRFENALSPWSFYPQNPYGALSRRERQCETEGTAIWRLLYRRV